MSTIKGIFFDLGGTLFHYNGGGPKVGAALMEAIGSLSGEAEIEPRTVGRAYRQANNEIAKRYAQLDFYLHSDLFRDIFQRTTELLKLPFRESVYAGFRDVQHTHVVHGLQLKEDCVATLEGLKQRGYYLSIVSNIDDDMLHPLVEREGLATWLDHWTSSEEARSCKPHAQFFEVSLDKARMRPEDVLFVGDSPEHDVNGAAALGMRTVLIKNGDDPAPLQSGAAVQDPDHTIHQLNELLELV